ncbi:MAG: methylated-DNA--[protein]-cysteine S-methyltransferase [Vicinamibacterales bacterium]|nr:methylated-DNA--[protein]-cysteine S-methyltransferase [Vicinamibacterales bacterium]
MPKNYVTVESPIGPLMLAGEGGVLHVLAFQSGPRAQGPDPSWTEAPGAFAGARAELDRYFAGTLRVFTAPIALHGTAFQLRVWEALRRIPYGETISYLELATRLGNPKAVRAVGLANGANPLPLIVPCHRVIGSNGRLVGFGGGLPIKRALLDHEQIDGQIDRQIAIW